MTTTLHFHPGAASVVDSAVWRLRVLGRFELDDGQSRLTRLRSRAAMVLLARLGMAPGRDHGREELAALLWPDADAESSRSRLRQTLSLLKAVLEPVGQPQVILADRRALRLAPCALWCDAADFEQALRRGHGEAAEALYLGELLPGFYDEWVVDERMRLQALVDRLAERLPGRHEPPALAQTSRSSAPDTARQAARPARAPAARLAPGQRLPQYLTRLIGADVSGGRLRALVSDQRLVLLLGAGGSGKSRLAVEVARVLSDALAGSPRFERAVFVSLVGAVSRTEVLDRLALALRVTVGSDVSEAILETLDRRSLLMLLDNAEQLDDSATGAIAHLAERLPAVHWLITSRRPLGLDGERHFVLDALPPPATDAPLAEVVLNPAVALFVDRARAHRPDFHVSAGQRAPLIDLVTWLEGLPLAIELAAAQTRTLAPAELLAVLRQARAQRQGAGLALLARRGARSGSDPRQASMRDVVAWSWTLLAPASQALLLAISGLPSGATLDTAAALVAAPGAAPDAAAVQAVLDDLVSQSVLRAGLGQDGQTRYRAMEPVREYLLALHDDAALQPLRRRALQALLHWAREMPSTPPLPRVRDELPNLSQALAAAAGDGDADAALMLVLLLQSAWGEIAMPAGVLDALDSLLQAEGLDHSRAAGGHALLAWSSQEAGRPDDVRRHRAAALALPCPDPTLRAMVLSRMARTFWRVDKDAVQARALVEQALPLARAARRPNTEASLLSLLGHLATVVDRDPVLGKSLSSQALALWAQSGNRHLINAGRYNVAVQTMEAGQPAQVLAEFEALAEEGRALQDWDLASGALEARGTALLKLRRWPEAAWDLRESLVVAWDGLEVQATLYALWNLPPVLARLRLGALAAQTMGAAEAHWLLRFGEMDRRDRRDLRRMRRFARAQLGADAAGQAWRQGAAMTLSQVVRAVCETLPATRPDRS